MERNLFLFNIFEIEIRWNEMIWNNALVKIVEAYRDLNELFLRAPRVTSSDFISSHTRVLSQMLKGKWTSYKKKKH